MKKLKFLGIKAVKPNAHGAFEEVRHAAPSKKKTDLTDPHSLLSKALFLMMRRKHEDGLVLLNAAIERAGAYANQAPIYSKAIRVCLRGKLHEKAEEILETAKQKFPNELGFSIQEAQIHISKGKPKDAVALLMPLHRKNPQNMVMATALAASYFHDGNARETIRYLRPFQESGSLDGPAAIVLGHAYLFLKDFKNYGLIKGFIQDPVSELYLTAASHYLQNNTAGALKILLNLEISDKVKMQTHVISLALACTGTEHPIHQAILEGFGEDFYKKRTQESKDWKNSPERSIQRNYSMTSSQGLFELGGNAVSGQANRAAGTSAPVHVKRTFG